jgi:hypothetical protein
MTISSIAAGICGLRRRGGRDEAALPKLIQLGRGRRLIRQLAREHLIHRDAQRIDVRRKHRAPLELLRSHVGRTADHGRPVRGYLEEARRAEVSRP